MLDGTGALIDFRGVLAIADPVVRGVLESSIAGRLARVPVKRFSLTPRTMVLLFDKSATGSVSNALHHMQQELTLSHCGQLDWHLYDLAGQADPFRSDCRRAVESAHRSARSNESVPNGTRPARESRATIESGATVETRVSPIAVVPRAGTDEDSADEPVRTVVAVGRAGVRRIVVVAVGANRSWSDYRWAHSDCHGSNSDSHTDLRLRRCRRNHQANCEHCHETENFCVSHFRPLLSFPSLILLEAHFTLSTDCRTR